MAKFQAILQAIIYIYIYIYLYNLHTIYIYIYLDCNSSSSSLLLILVPLDHGDSENSSRSPAMGVIWRVIWKTLERCRWLLGFFRAGASELRSLVACRPVSLSACQPVGLSWVEAARWLSMHASVASHSIGPALRRNGNLQKQNSVPKGSEGSKDVCFSWGVRLLTSFARLRFWQHCSNPPNFYWKTRWSSSACVRLSIPTRKELEEVQQISKDRQDMTRLYRLYLPLLWDELKLKSDESTSSVLAMSLWRWQRLPSCLCALEKLSTSTNFCTNFFPYESAGLTEWSIPMRGMNGMNRNEYESMNGFTQSHGCTLPYFAIVYCLFQHVSMFATRELSPMSPWGWNASGCWESALVWPKQGQKQRRRSLRQQISTDFNRFQQLT